MKAVLEAAPCWRSRLTNYGNLMDAFLAEEPEDFARAMDAWTRLTMGIGCFGGLTEEEVQRVDAPALVIPGRNKSHPQDTGRRLARLLPNSTLEPGSDEAWRLFFARFDEWQAAGGGYDSGPSPAFRFLEDIAPVVGSFVQELV